MRPPPPFPAALDSLTGAALTPEISTLTSRESLAGLLSLLAESLSALTKLPLALARTTAHEELERNERRWRAIVKNVRDTAQARSLYAKYVGA